MIWRTPGSQVRPRQAVLPRPRLYSSEVDNQDDRRLVFCADDDFLRGSFDRNRPFSPVVARRTWPGGDPGCAACKRRTLFRAGLAVRNALTATPGAGGA